MNQKHVCGLFIIHHALSVSMANVNMFVLWRIIDILCIIYYNFEKFSNCLMHPLTKYLIFSRLKGQQLWLPIWTVTSQPPPHLLMLLWETGWQVLRTRYTIYTRFWHFKQWSYLQPYCIKYFCSFHLLYWIIRCIENYLGKNLLITLTLSMILDFTHVYYMIVAK